MTYTDVGQIGNVFLVNPMGAARLVSGGDLGSGAHSLLHRIIGLREPAMRERLARAVSAAIAEHVASVVLWRATHHEGIGRLIIVRPAREPGHAIVALDDLDMAPASVSPEHLSELFGLSKSEAEIAIGLAKDDSVSALAHSRGVQIETVRGQIKNVLRKMGLSSQKQLVRVLTRIGSALD